MMRQGENDVRGVHCELGADVATVQCGSGLSEIGEGSCEGSVMPCGGGKGEGEGGHNPYRGYQGREREREVVNVSFRVRSVPSCVPAVLEFWARDGKPIDLPDRHLQTLA